MKIISTFLSHLKTRASDNKQVDFVALPRRLCWNNSVYVDLERSVTRSLVPFILVYTRVWMDLMFWIKGRIGEKQSFEFFFLCWIKECLNTRVAADKTPVCSMVKSWRWSMSLMTFLLRGKTKEWRIYSVPPNRYSQNLKEEEKLIR